MIISDNEVNDRFKELLKAYTQVDIATAWATGGEHLRILAKATNREQRPVKVRAIVGTTGNATHPDALEELYRITNGDLRIIRDGDRMFHPKLYLFRRQTNGREVSQAWVGSANFTRAGFGRREGASNEEIIVQLGPGKTTEELAEWFQKRWDQCSTDPPVREVIDTYTKDWNPPNRDIQEVVSGGGFSRVDLLEDVQTLEGYRQALKECEAMLQGEDPEWYVLNSQRRSYIRVIEKRNKLLLGEKEWSLLDRESQIRLKGGVPHTDSSWWGMLGRMARSNGQAVWSNENVIRPILKKVESADDTEFPDIAEEAFRKLKRIDNVAHGTASLLLTLARPDRLLSLNGPSEKAYGKLSGLPYSTLSEPQNYRKLLVWLYRQPWYTDSKPTDEALAQIWQFRAALLDAFVYELT